MKATEVFVPSDFPTATYVERGAAELETAIRNALDTPKSPISVSGPSKTGKTALVRKILGEDNIIHIFGIQIESPQDLWSVILSWMDVPNSITSGSTGSETFKPTVSTAAEVGIPGFGKVSIGGGVSTETSATEAASSARTISGMASVAREIAHGDFVIFLDDFHYIPRALQEDVGKQIKSASDAGIRFIIASVPHRSDDVVRSNHELRGRSINIDTDYWSIEDLVKIGLQGFSALHYEVDASVLNSLAKESCTSPQIMQALLLQLCFDLDLRESVDSMTRIHVSNEAIHKALEQTSMRAAYSSLLKQMHAGPRTRGTERKEFKFVDGSSGDAYRACLLALTQDPPAMEFNYADLQSRIAQVCIDDRPVGSSITESLKQISMFAEQMHPNQRIVEWDPDAASGTFAIVDPYFLFSLRSSDQLSRLAK